MLFKKKQSSKAVGETKSDKKSNGKKPKNKEKKSGLIKNMRIAPKLLIGFIIIALMGAGIGVFSSVNIDTLSAQNEQMYKEMLLPMRYISQISDSFQGIRVALRSMLMNDWKSITLNEFTIKNKQSLFETNISMLETYMVNDSKGRVASLKNNINDYNTRVDDAIESIKAGDGDKIKYSLSNIGDLYMTEKGVESALERINAAATEEASAQQSASKGSVERAKLITYAIIGFELIVSAIIAIFIARGISKPVNKLTNGLKLLAAGDTDIPSMGINSKDEIGQMRTAFRSIIASINGLNEDTDMLIEAAAEGQLSIRADAEKHQGSYRKIIEGFNATLDAVTMPVNEAAKVLDEVSKGNLDTFVSGDFKGDHAIIKNSLNETIETLKGYIDEISGALGEISMGNLDVEITSEYRGDFIELKNSINKIVSSLSEMLSEINLAAEQMTMGTRQLSQGSQEISQGATEQAGAIDELTATITQMAQQTKQNAMGANQANELTLEAKNDAAQGNSHMKTMQNAMTEINEASENISKIIKVIDDIAFQTNILALNAAVEAARAGTHGKGFAVVAEEVRNLAARSANAARETAELIEGSIKKTEAGTKIADDTAGSLSNIVKGVEKAAQLVSEIAAASNEQAGAIAQVNSGIEQVSQVIQTNSATSEEAAAAAEELSSQAELLKEMVGRFRLKGAQATCEASEPEPVSQEAYDQEKTAPRIMLSDSEFGKY